MAKVLSFIPEGTKFKDQLGDVWSIVGSPWEYSGQEVTMISIKNELHGYVKSYSVLQLFANFQRIPKKRHLL